MIVVGIIGMAMAVGIPAFARAMHKEGMRRALDDINQAMTQARANAILSGQPADLIIHPGGRGGQMSVDVTGPGKFSAILPKEVSIEILGVNFVEMQTWDQAKVTFQPNATCDEFAMVIKSEEGEYYKITLEPLSGLETAEKIR
jgi:Tfp pilus assembly protein FimT